MTHITIPAPPLLPEWAFVVQFHEGTGMEHDRMEGRVEHIVSGQAIRFHSLEELLTFMTRVLTALHT